MTKNLWIKTLLIVVVLLVFLYGIFGMPQKLSGEGLKSAILERIHLGLDLKGGTHLILQVVVNDAVNADTDRAVERLKEDLRSHNLSYSDISKPDPVNHPEQIVLKGVPPEASGDLRSLVQDRLPEYNLTSQAENNWLLEMKPTVANDLKNRAVTQAIETIRNRVDQLGVSEPTIQEHGLGQYQILVQLPGVDDPARVKQIIQSTAMLEIRQAISGPYASEQEALQANGGMLPANTVLLKGRSIGSTGEAPQEAYYIVTRSSAVSGTDLRQAQPGRDENGRPDVTFILTGDGGRRFANFTGAHVGDKLAVVLDNKVMEVATIQEQIHDTGRITGAFTEQQTKDLAMILNSGALPASIRYLEERTVGPSLGADSVRQGIIAILASTALVFVFMMIYYRLSGLIADVALGLNLLLLLATMAGFHATLTLPGIAGIALTIGMAVDTNILIFERIREELRGGKTIRGAIEAGFSRAFKTVIDTHVTVLVSGLILFQFGTGPVKGFAVTLMIGIAASLFTAVFFTRLLFDLLYMGSHKRESLSI